MSTLRRSRSSASSAAILAAAALYALSPAVIHLTAEGTNPYLFNLIQLLLQMACIGVCLLCLRGALLDRYPLTDLGIAHPSAQVRPLSIGGYCLSFRRASGGGISQDSRIEIRQSNWHDWRSWHRMPLAWMVFGSFTLGTFALATRFVETAVAAAVFELWPLFFVYGRARLRAAEGAYLGRERPRRAVLTPEQIVLTGLAAVGILLMLGSQTDAALGSFRSLVSFDAVLGIVLALLAAAQSALAALGGLAWGQIRYYSLIDDQQPENQRVASRLDSRVSADVNLALWLTLLGSFAGRLLSLPANMALAVGISDISFGLTAKGVLGAAIVGLAVALSTILLRIGNIALRNPEVNALFFTSPLISLTLLLILGVTLPRIDVFVIGATLIVAINVLIQLNPDTRRAAETFAGDGPARSRLGFTAFILTLWLAGSFVYLRDEIMPDGWLVWRAPEYWGALTLSATVFALILGFRLARVSSRIRWEDEAAILMFRRSERLAEDGVLDDAVLDDVSRFESARPNGLLETYNRIRAAIVEARRRTDDASHLDQLWAMEAQLDSLAHSKQQGRDLAELISLSSFAMLAIALSLFVRPVELGVDAHAWSGATSEIFAFLFASTVAFLTFNLFDIRRERETPLIRPVRQRGGDMALFFRYARVSTARQSASVVVSAMVSAALSVLLLDKWL